MKSAELSDLVTRCGQRSTPPAAPDSDLLGRFVAEHDERAFSLLVRRHGPLVLSVCRRVIGDHHLAEDAFQAVFVVLAAKADSVRPPSALPAWLYGVAYRIALRTRTVSDRRRRREEAVETLPESAPTAAHTAEVADLVTVLDEEIARLPEYQRVPVVLCELEGRSRQEAAAQLGILEGTLSSRLARARRALADRLRRRGITLSAAGLTAALAQLAPASVPSGLVSKAVDSAIGSGLVPAAVATLSHGVLRIMFLRKLKVLVVASAVLASALFAAHRLTAGDPPGTPTPTILRTAEPIPSRPDQPPPKPAAEKPLAQGPNKLLLFRDRRLVLLDPDGKNEKEVTADREAVHGDARLSPDGKRVVVRVRSGVDGGEQQKLHVRALDEKGAGTDLGVECKTLVSLLWSSDGTEIAYTEGSGDGVPEFAHFVVDVKTKEKRSLKLPDGHLLTDWSRDGKLFLTTRFVTDKEKAQARWARLYLVNRDGTEHKALSDEKRFSAFGRLSPDGTRVLYGLVTHPKDGKGLAKRELTVLDVPTGKSAAVGDTPLNGEIGGYCWSPDGKQIAYTWRETHEGKSEDIANKETESHLVVCDPNGKNAKTVASEKGNSPWTITLGWPDWR